MSSRVISPLVSVNPTTGPSKVVVTGIPNVPLTSSHIFQNFQNNPSSSTYFVQGYPWYGGHIPPFSPFVGPVPTYSGVSLGGHNPFLGFSFQNFG